MQEVIMTGLVVVIIVSSVVWAYGVGKANGVHKERMRLIDIMNNMPTVVATQEHVAIKNAVWYVVNYIVNRLKEE